MLLYDAHAHIHLTTHHHKVIEKFQNAGGSMIFNVLSDFSKLPQFLELVQKYQIVKAAIGIHPTEIKNFESPKMALNALEETIQKLRKRNIHLTAIGEIGLDTYYDNTQLELQREILRLQLEYSRKHKLPAVFHVRGKNANDYKNLIQNILSILKNLNMLDYKLYFHSFVGDKELLKLILNKTNAFIGINGIISYTSGITLREACEYLPISRLLLETDSPFLIPSNLPRDLLTKRDENEPLGTLYVAKIIAKIKNKNHLEIIEKTYNNLKNLIDL